MSRPGSRYPGRVKSSAPPRPAARPSRLRPLWLAAGFLFTGLGVLGLILPVLPGTIWFILAAAAFARGDERWEAWLLSRPVIGELVRDFRAGRGMPARAKWIACLSITLAVALSVPRIPAVAGQVATLLLGVAGVAYILFMVPTRRA